MDRKRRRAESAKHIVVEPTATTAEEEVLTRRDRPHLKSGFSVTVEPPSQPFNWCSLGFFLVLIVVFLLLLYYFNDFLSKFRKLLMLMTMSERNFTFSLVYYCHVYDRIKLRRLRLLFIFDG